ncbi:cation:proton antiporter domain-containing protein [Streptomyces virginiae]|uniref:cation:proton antiporter domain-containing protein n=1 Tax=Streptomyces virginiae TaxID=1961 RepID=UPI00342D7C01
MGVTRTLLESALVLVLFTDAVAIRLRDLRREEFLPLRLFVVGLPLTTALGWLLAWPLLPGLSVWELALVAIILAPTDAALGQQAFSNEQVPALVRGGLGVEPGLNDGLPLPFFVLALAAAGESEGHPGVVVTSCGRCCSAVRSESRPAGPGPVCCTGRPTGAGALLTGGSS